MRISDRKRMESVEDGEGWKMEEEEGHRQEKEEEEEEFHNVMHMRNEMGNIKLGDEK
jgi:hypothetical protein